MSSWPQTNWLRDSDHALLRRQQLPSAHHTSTVSCTHNTHAVIRPLFTRSRLTSSACFVASALSPCSCATEEAFLSPPTLTQKRSTMTTQRHDAQPRQEKASAEHTSSSPHHRLPSRPHHVTSWAPNISLLSAREKKENARLGLRIQKISSCAKRYASLSSSESTLRDRRRRQMRQSWTCVAQKVLVSLDDDDRVEHGRAASLQPQKWHQLVGWSRRKGMKRGKQESLRAGQILRDVLQDAACLLPKGKSKGWQLCKGIIYSLVCFPSHIIARHTWASMVHCSSLEF